MPRIPVYVLIVTYNRLEWLKEAIESIPTDPSTHVFILDNGSTDGTTSYLETTYHGPYTYKFYRPQNLPGAFAHLLEHLPLAATPLQDYYICLFADDDHMLPNGIEAKRIMLDQNPSLGLVFSRVRLMDANSNDLGISPMGHIFDEDRPTGALSFYDLILGDYIPMPSVMFRLSMFSQHIHLLGSTVFGPTTDWQLWLSGAADAMDGGYIHEPTVSLRQHPGQDSAIHSNNGTYLAYHMVVWEYWLEQGWSPDPESQLRIHDFIKNIAAFPALTRFQGALHKAHKRRTTAI